jgi:hypothetical protein
MSLLIYGLVALFLAILAALLRPAYRYWTEHDHKHGFGYEVAKDFFSPLLLAVIGFGFAVQLNRQQVITAENQSKEAALREMMTSRNGPDVAFFTAVGIQLNIHLRRYERFLAAQKAGKVDKQAEDAAAFEKKATYFFYGMYRVAIIDFSATKGYVLYPRIWMEQAFEGLNHGFAKQFAPEAVDSAHPEEEAALYRYFGAMKATYHTGTKRADEGFPDLFEFTSLMDKTPIAPGSSAHYLAMVASLREGFSRFEKRLDSPQFHPHDAILGVEAMIGLDDYAFNAVFSKWYQQFDPEPPTELSKFLTDPPDDFLRYQLYDFDDTFGVVWCTERQQAWRLLLEKVDPALKEKCGEKTRPCANSHGT